MGTHDSMTLESYHTDYILTNKRDDLTSHLKSHGYTSEKYKAEFMAAYRFNSEATLHMTDDSNWSDQNKFDCKVEGCSEKLTSRVRLVLHIQKVHTRTALQRTSITSASSVVPRSFGTATTLETTCG